MRVQFQQRPTRMDSFNPTPEWLGQGVGQIWAVAEVWGYPALFAGCAFLYLAPKVTQSVNTVNKAGYETASPLDDSVRVAREKMQVLAEERAMVAEKKRKEEEEEKRKLRLQELKDGPQVCRGCRPPTTDTPSALLEQRSTCRDGGSTDSTADGCLQTKRVAKGTDYSPLSDAAGGAPLDPRVAPLPLQPPQPAAWLTPPGSVFRRCRERRSVDRPREAVRPGRMRPVSAAPTHRGGGRAPRTGGTIRELSDALDNSTRTVGWGWPEH